jgi:hypothetical protein
VNTLPFEVTPQFRSQSRRERFGSIATRVSLAGMGHKGPRQEGSPTKLVEQGCLASRRVYDKACSVSPPSFALHNCCPGENQPQNNVLSANKYMDYPIYIFVGVVENDRLRPEDRLKWRDEVRRQEGGEGAVGP